MTTSSQPVSAAPPDGAPKLKRSMGLWMATALVVGNMIGSGVFLLPATLAGTAGPISMLGWLFTGAGAVLLALVFANLGRALPRQGFILLLAGIPVYIGMRWWERRKLEHLTVPEPEKARVIAGAR
jgi:amino acid transporter